MVSCSLYICLLHYVSSSPGTNTDCAAADGAFEKNYKVDLAYSYTRLDRETEAHNFQNSRGPALRISF